MHAIPPRRPRKPRRRWRWHVPPALMDAGESLEGIQILEEYPNALGILLWETFRDVALWSGVAEEERAGLFGAAAAEARAAAVAAHAPPEVQPLLEAASAVLREPGTVDGAAVLAACRGLAEWAERRDSPRTAVALATAAALAVPTDAAAAFRVGQLARRNAEIARAETWFRRTIGLGRQGKDWAAYSEAFLGLGNLYAQRGNYPAARRFYVRALRAARRHGLRDLHAFALHQLFTAAVDTGDADAAEQYATAAFRAYGGRHPRLPALAHDVAYYWLTRGMVQPALDVFRAVLPHVHAADERLAVCGTLGRAAGAAGNRDEFDGAWDAVWARASEWDIRPKAPEALLDVAHGAASLRDWSRAERAATAAHELARRRGEARVALTAEAVLDAVGRKRGIEEPQPAAPYDGTGTLAEELIRSLRIGGAAR
jgi:tetratricopeptide (TPR) repeat protein